MTLCPAAGPSASKECTVDYQARLIRASAVGCNLSEHSYPIALMVDEVAPRKQVSFYPEPFASRMAGREKRQLGDGFGITNFGVNLTRLRPGASSALRHAHMRQDEFIFVLQAAPVLVTDAGRSVLSPGMCAGFKAGTGDAHHLINQTNEDVVYLEIGDRTAGDEATYPVDDFEGVILDGRRVCRHKDGRLY